MMLQARDKYCVELLVFGLRGLVAPSSLVPVLSSTCLREYCAVPRTDNVLVLVPGTAPIANCYAGVQYQALQVRPLYAYCHSCGQY